MGLLCAGRLIWDSHPTQKSTILLSFPVAHVPLDGERVVILRACLHVYLFILLKRLKLQKAFSTAACALLDSIASGAAVFNRADNAAMPAAVRFVSPSHRVPAAALERAATAIQMPPRWQWEECASAHLDDSKAVICAETLSCSAENPALAQAVFNLRSWLLLKRAISYTDEGA